MYTKADFVLIGDTDMWRKVFVGDESNIRPCPGQIKVEGSTALLIKNMGAFMNVIEATGRIDFV